ncbi:hypothetical protein QZH41_008753, partial [Actinostola sp. cb2023]
HNKTLKHIQSKYDLQPQKTPKLRKKKGVGHDAQGKDNLAFGEVSTDSDSSDEVLQERELIVTIATGPCGVLGDIGFELYGGRGNEVDYDDNGIYVEDVTPESDVAKTLEPGDQILKIGGHSVLDVPLHHAMNLIRAADSRIVINILKHPDNAMAPKIPDDSEDDSGPELEEEEKSKGSNVRQTMMVDETDDGEEVQVGFMSGRPGNLDVLDFDYAGGKDSPFVPKNGGIFITSVKLGSILEENISPGDKIIKLEGVDVTNVPQFAFVNLIRASHGKATMTVRKANKQQVNASAFTDDIEVCVNALGVKDELIVEIKAGPKGRRGQLGFKITGGRDKPCKPGDPGVFIKGVKPGSKIDKILKPGDKLLKVEGKNVTNATQGQVMDLIKAADHRVLLHIKRSSADEESKKKKSISEMFDATQLEEFVSAFDLYSNVDDQKMVISRLPRLCRALGFNFTGQDLEYMTTHHDNGIDSLPCNTMAAKKDVVFGLTIFLAVSAVLLTVAVVYIAIYFRKLRKKIQTEFFSETKEIKKLTVHKRNKYIPSKHRKSVQDQSYYESPPLTENQKERLQQRALQKQNANITDDTTNMEMKEIPKVSNTDSYITCINDDEDLVQDYVTQFNESRHDEELYIELFEDEVNVNVFAALSHNKPVTRGRDSVTQHQVSHNMKSHAKTMPSSRPEVSSVPKSSYNINRPKTFESRVTQHVVTHNASVSSNSKNLKYTCDPPDDQEMYVDMQPGVDVHPDNDELYGNQVIIDDVYIRDTGIPTPGVDDIDENNTDEIYGNQDTIDDVYNRDTGIPTPGVDDIDENNTDEIYGNQDTIDDEIRKRFTEYTGYPSDEEMYENQQTYQQYDVT